MITICDHTARPSTRRGWALYRPAPEGSHSPCVLDHITEDELALYAGRPHHDIDCRDAVDYFTFNNKMRLGLCVIHETTARRWMISEKNDWAFSARPLKTMEG